MMEAGFTLSGTEHPICPVMLYDAALASSFADELLKRGIYVIGFSFPVVPKGGSDHFCLLMEHFKYIFLLSLCNSPYHSLD